MLSFTDEARKKVLSFISQYGLEDQALRISAGGSPLSPQYDFTLVGQDEQEADDVVYDAGDFLVLMDPDSALRMDGAQVHYVEDVDRSGFDVQKARPPAEGEEGESDGPMAEKVRQLLEERVNPAIASHGGRITLVDVKDHVAYVEMAGGCQGCGMARVTLRQGVERMIRQSLPEIREIVDVTDHGAGVNPYYEG